MIKQHSLNDDRLLIITRTSRKQIKKKKTLFIFISLKVTLKNYSQHEYHFRYILFSGSFPFIIRKTFCRFKQKKIWNMFSRYYLYIHSLLHCVVLVQLARDYYARNIVFYPNDLFSFFDRVLLQKFYLLPKYHRDKGSIKSSTWLWVTLNLYVN